VLKNNGKLLKPETVKMRFTHQLDDPKYLLQAAWNPDLGIMVRAGVASEDWQYGFGGTLQTADIPGMCKKGTCPDKACPTAAGLSLYSLFLFESMTPISSLVD
jgi:hypothetical protein